MDQTQPISSQQPVATNPQISTPSTPQPVPVETTPPSNKTPFFLIAIAVVLLAVIGGAYILMSRSTPSQTATQTIQPESTPIPTSIPTLAEEEQEVDSIEIPELEKDFTDLNQDAQGL